MTAFHHLLSPIKLGKVEIRNRVVLTGHGTGMPKDGRPNEQMIAYYEQRAKGEVGLIMLGSQQVHPSSPGITGLLCNYDDTIIPGLRAVSDAVHLHGTRIFGYLSHMGLATSARPTALWSASAVYEQKYGEVAHPMTLDEIEELVEAHADAAARCIEAGMDGIEVHCGHGLLIQQFLSPLTNKRTDLYGGPVENRVRFPQAVLAAVRKRVGPDIPVGIRCSGDELVEGGLTAADMAEIVPLLVKAGALDYVDVSAGTDGDLVSNMLHEPPMGLEPAPFKSVARRIKDEIDVPVIHGTRIHTPALADEMIAAGDADMAGMCRALIADPFLPKKARTGQAHDITPCIGCEQACFGRLYRGRHISCIGNPVTGRELAYAQLQPVQTPKHIVIVGGGPSGIEAAVVSSRRGHRVTLIEQSDQLGGRMRLAMKPKGREEWSKLLAHKLDLLDRLGVDIRTGTKATPELIRSLQPDEVVLATGTSFEPLDVEGASSAPILTVDEVVADPSKAGRKVLVVDYLDRQPAMVTAIMLAEMGRSVEMSTASFHVGQKLEIQNITYFYAKALATGIVFTPTVVPRRFDGGSVTFHNVFTRTDCRTERYDTIVIAAPGVPQAGLAEALKAASIKTTIIGDAYAARDIEAAILDGFETGAAA
ncbi:2,4-dienoyl-CoA reductase [Xaviernesmea oryzae]|uniref:2,4-dienoyl-CoA reductase n=1 Tax=Xaviernesmea oryzae TaxID=464029 RepID=A0A1X7EIY8_9HYPH|nr:FAD-dependent oxidoreductase [Xaviernesmea oryzae]SMF34658.1 2,4-dienoyl-CoA reductase [Xaviernesmea oryzae]